MRRSSSLDQWWVACFTASSSSAAATDQKLRLGRRGIPFSWIFNLAKPNNPKPKHKGKKEPGGSTINSSSSPSVFSSSLASSASSSISSSHRKSNYFTRNIDSSKQPPRKSQRTTRRSTSVSDTVLAFQNSLHPIITKEEEECTVPRRRSKSVVSPRNGVRLRTNTPRVRGRSDRRRGVAVVKSSRDPRRDFMESMVEMIVENDLRDSRELEELLARYLSLNSEQYHDLIITVFKQLWFDFVAPRPSDVT